MVDVAEKRMTVAESLTWVGAKIPFAAIYADSGI